ncbi:MAG: helix-turn-helix transcriptional regulator [Stenotrophomonas sp.]|uniref:helix-turn-helix transcriptional regulator n=1 Tax=Stenotrophomonas sp. TaxID=69392 RepID=UPI003D6C998C
MDLHTQPLPQVHAIVGNSRGSRLTIPAGWISITLVLRGVLELASGDSPWQLISHHQQLWLDGGLRLVSRTPCWWLCVAAPAPLWRELPHSSPCDTSLIPVETRCPTPLARALVHISRTHWFDKNCDAGTIIDNMVWLRDAIVEHQDAQHQQMDRCSGRTALRRHQTLLRLLRVQHLIRCNIDDRIDLTRLAAIANYSPTHLIRVYREVFGETPSEYATRLRHQRAWELVRSTEMSVCEIADALGFESESAFCRAFKHAFGCTTSEARRGARAMIAVHGHVGLTSDDARHIRTGEPVPML